MTKIFTRRLLKPIRKKLRDNPSRAELILWSKIKNKQINDCKFRRQHSIGNFVVDFYCPKSKLVIEIDGDSHFASKKVEKYDKDRQKFIEGQEIELLRFTNNDIYNNLEGVLIEIASATSPSPSLERRGNKDK